jgi:hypothetical protein
MANKKNTTSPIVFTQFSVTPAITASNTAAPPRFLLQTFFVPPQGKLIGFGKLMRYFLTQMKPVSTKML